ncbi:mucoidy inhibitor MuiA family protein, partial [Thermodesulfobacteriota bacterium]
MKKLTLFFFLFLIAEPLALAQETIPSRINEVTLFSNQAQITREADVQAKNGLNEFLLEVGAFRIDSDSVTARVFGEGEIFGVQIKEIHLKESPQKNINDLEKKIKDLERSIRSSQNEKKILGNKETFLSSLIDFSKTQVPQDIKTEFPKIEDLNKALIFMTDAYEEIRTKKESLQIRIEEANEELRVLKKELASLKNRQQKIKRMIEILFNSKKAQSLKIVTSYVVRNAYWSPLYKADVPLDLKDVNLKMFSKIKQKTGEDWNDTELKISNIIPLQGVKLPSLVSWFLDPAPIRPGSALAMKRGVEKLEKQVITRRPAMSAIDSDKELKEAELVSARRKELPLSFEYQLPQKISIESKDKDTILPLFSKTLKGKFFYHAVPRINPLTFLVCRTIADKELLSGPLNVHFGGRFVGKTLLREKKAGQKFDLNLGADREIKVRREKIKDKIKETFFGKIERGTIIRELAYKITLENLKNKPIRIEIIDS